MNATDAAQISFTSPQSNFLVQYGGFIGSLLASATALFIAGGGGRWLKEKYYKPHLRVKGNIKRYEQAHHVWRIAVSNDGNEIASDVQAEVTKLSLSGKPRKNFVPMPLSWTHKVKDSRDILPEQTVHLDIIEHYVNTSEKEAHLASPRGHGVSDFRKIDVSDQVTTLEISIYERRGRILKIKVDIGLTAPLFLDAKVQGKSWSLGIFKSE